MERSYRVGVFRSLSEDGWCSSMPPPRRCECYHSASSLVRDPRWCVVTLEAAHKEFQAELRVLKASQEGMGEALTSLKNICSERLGTMGAAVLGDLP
uniref:Uncharacterized protein n=1 Tax=Sphaerodactylus townsendi TaxID=933632 RepID=A0ACB8EMD5_9SAUR